MWLCTAVAVIVTSVAEVIVAGRGVEIGSCMGDFAARQPIFRLWGVCVSVGETSCYMNLFNLLSIDLRRSGRFIATAVAGVRGFCPSPRQLETSATAFVEMAVRTIVKYPRQRLQMDSAAALAGPVCRAVVVLFCGLSASACYCCCCRC